MSATYYDWLGITKSASPDDVRRAYKQKALETHPDKYLYPGASERDKRAAEARFQKVHEAFEILIDPQKRSSYDARMETKGDRGNRSAVLSQRQQRREKERAEWARQVEKQHQERMRALREPKEQPRARRQQLEQKDQPLPEHQNLVEDMLKELYSRNPEWEARKKKVQGLKAERSGASGNPSS